MEFQSTGTRPRHLPTVDVGTVPVTVCRMEDAVQEVLSLALASRITPQPVPIRLVNAYSIALGNARPDYGQVLRGEGINFPDGRPVALVAGQLHHEHADQVRGPDLFERVLEAGVGEGLRHYFYGTTDETLHLLQAQLVSRFPGLQVVGLDAPAFAPVDELASDEVAARIREAKPDVLWVGLGTPKQDHVAVRLARKLEIPTLGVGAAFDFSAGTLAVAPEVLRRAGLEWAFRFAKEPRRLWKRYLVGNAHFLTLAARDVTRARGGRR